MRFKWVFLLVFSIWSFGQVHLAVAQTQPVFSTPTSFVDYSPPSGGCTDCTAYLATSMLTGDFNGDGKVDFAYVAKPNEGVSDQLFVTAIGSASGTPTQVGTDLKQCSATFAGAVADVNGDGRDDVVIVCSQGYAATLLSNGDGTFQSPVLSIAPSGSQQLVVADFNGDGLADVAYSIFLPRSIINGYAIALNTGGGKFGAPTTYSLPLGGAIAAGDFNGDGKQDLVFGGSGYILGNGDGTFGAEQSLPSGITQLVVGDFNKDGYVDVAFLQSTSGTTPGASIELIPGSSSGLSAEPIVLTGDTFAGALLQALKLTATGNLDLVATFNGLPTILLGNGDGSFSTPLSYGNTVDVFADVNADGALDLVTEVGGTGFSVILGNADGTSQAWPRTLISGLGAIAVGDFNGDGLSDAAVQRPSNEAPEVYLSTGDGHFQGALQGSTIGSGDFGTLFLAADLNGDGHPDLLSISPGWGECHPECPGPEDAQLLTYLGKGDGTLSYTGQVNLGVEIVSGAVIGEFNGDGNPDLVVIYFDGDTFVGGAIFAAGKGDGTFASPVQIPLLGQQPMGIAAADLNGDKKLDLVVADSSGTVATYLGKGDGAFDANAQILETVAYSPVLADVTGDGIPDLECATSNKLQVFSGNGDGSFASNPVYSTGVTYYPGLPNLQVGDLNGDGLPDIVSSGSNEMQVFLNQGSGTFSGDGGYPTAAVALATLNRNAISQVHKANLDVLSQQSGLISLLNLNNPSPGLAASSSLLLTTGSGTTVGVGQTITLTAGLESAAGATGTIQFFSNQQATATCSLAQNECSVSIPASTAGTYAIEAEYEGDASHPGATAFLTLTALPPTATTLAVNSVDVAQGATIAFAARVTPSTATGTVTFTDGERPFFGPVTMYAGVATFSGGGDLAVGTHAIVATYNGDSADAPSASSPLSITIMAASSGHAPTTITLSAGAPSVAQGAGIGFTAKVAPATATGTVKFSDGETVLGALTLNGGKAIFSTRALAVGTHSIVATYGGDSADAPSTSSAAIVTITTANGGPVATTTALAVSAASVAQGASVTFTARVAPAAATGTVKFSDGGTVLGTGILSGGIATFSTSGLAVGTHSITASYGGDSADAASTSSAAGVMVTAPSGGSAATTTTLSASAASVAQGVSVTFTAHVAPSTAGGTVIFSDRGTAFGAGTLSGGVATFSTTALAVGTHSITAAYGGDANDAASTSSSVSVMIAAAGSGPGATTTTLSASSANVEQGASVTFTAHVAPSTAGGTVVFSDRGIAFGAGTLSGGVATFSTTALAVGTHSITAAYGGDSKDGASTSSSVSVMITAASSGPAATTTTLSANSASVAQGASVTFTTHVAPSTAGGTVLFSDGGTVFGAGTLSGGVAAFSTTDLGVGTHLIAAAYGGDAQDAASTSSSVSVMITAASSGPGATTTTLSASSASVAQGVKRDFYGTRRSFHRKWYRYLL